MIFDFSVSVVDKVPQCKLCVEQRSQQFFFHASSVSLLFCAHQRRSNWVLFRSHKSNPTRKGRNKKTSTMFSWSNSNSTSSSRTKSTYPGRRSQQSRAAVGSARPSSSSISRAQHLTSYIEDPTLKRSTRRVSSGTFST